MTTKQLKQLSKLNVIELRCTELKKEFWEKNPQLLAFFLAGVHIQKNWIKGIKIDAMYKPKNFDAVPKYNGTIFYN